MNNEKDIVISILQKKCQDLLSTNLILEVNLVVEQNKNAQNLQKISELEKKVESLNKRKKKDEPALDGSSY